MTLQMFPVDVACIVVYATRFRRPREQRGPIKQITKDLTYQSWHSQGSALGWVGQEAVRRRRSFSVKVPVAYAAVLRYRVQGKSDSSEEKQKVNNLILCDH